MFVLGFAGPKGAGKTTAAHAVEFAVRQSFADPLKAALRAMGIHEQFLSGHLKEMPIGLSDITGRRLMQTLGTEWGRDLIHPDWWVWLARNEIEPLMRRVPVVIDDVRFPNEVAMIRELGGKVAWVHPWVHRPDDQHVSERMLTQRDCDYVIGSGTREKTKAQAYRIANDLYAEKVQKILG